MGPDLIMLMLLTVIRSDILTFGNCCESRVDCVTQPYYVVLVTDTSDYEYPNYNVM